CDIPAKLQEVYGEPEAFAAALSKHRPTIVALNTSFSLLKHSPEAKVALIDHVRWADAAGIRWLRAFDGKSDLPLDEAVEAAAAVIDWWKTEQQKGGWRADLIMETHDTFSTAAAMR